MTNSSNESAVNSPYVLQPTDNLGVSLVTCLLKEDNCSTWQRAITNALLAKNKMGFVDGCLPRPEANSPDEAAWIKRNSMELWKDSEERFSQGNAPCVHQLKMEIVNTQQRDQSVVTYYTKLKGLWDEYGSYSNTPKCTCGTIKEFATEKEKEKVLRFLMGLHDKFNVVRSQILNIEPLPSLARVYGLVAQKER
ncbi:uncharacterized protein LOC110654881 [Hevea brasiliensis]|uniref:uncharacterized protein LOC110654881 n=1 Tax=Hevea brasiliensis TaxID=3981 RepID=UPI000B77F618|nr:uncharacterized protein LOC110654881 [Hevea brasiliensis]